MLTTLCYIEKGDSYLMLHRIKKESDVNKDKWIGVGGHFEEDESPEDCLLREVKEETGLTLTSYKFRGIVTFIFKPLTGNRTQNICVSTQQMDMKALCVPAMRALWNGYRKKKC